MTEPRELFRAPPAIEPERASAFREDVALARREGEPDVERDAFLVSPTSARIAARLAAAEREAAARSAASTSAGRARRRWFVGIMASAALAAGLLWFVLPSLVGDGGTSSPRDDLRVKGGPSSMLTLVRERAGVSVTVRDGEALPAGEKVRFLYETRRSYVLVLSIESTGAMTVFHPHGGLRSAPVQPGRGVLAGAIGLDAARGDERVVAFFTDAPLSVERARALLDAAYPLTSGTRDVRAARPVPFEGETSGAWFHKAVR